MNSEELKAWRQKRQLTQEAVAKLLGVHRVTIAKWEAETRGIPPFLPLALEQLRNRLNSGQDERGLKRGHEQEKQNSQ